MIIVVVGPTAVGKTKLSIELAKRYNCEVINGDSTQIYKGLDIATAKVTDEEKEGIPHYLLDIKDISDDYTVFDYQRDCREKIAEIQDRKKIPIIVGGTGLYIKAALYDYKFITEKNNIDYSNYTNEELYSKLKQIDSNTTIHINNRKRVERALVRYETTGELPEKTSKILYNVVFIGLQAPREILYEKINKRVDIMIKKGLLEEAKFIYDSNIRTKAVLTPIGYKELFLYFDGKCTLEESIELIKKRSRNYAKRQYTWFNNQMDITWFNVDFNCFENTIQEVENYLDNIM